LATRAETSDSERSSLISAAGKLGRSLATLDPISADVLDVKGGAAEFLAEVIARQLRAILEDGTGDDAEKSRRQLELVNDLPVTLRQRLSARGSKLLRANVPTQCRIQLPKKKPTIFRQWVSKFWLLDLGSNQGPTD